MSKSKFKKFIKIIKKSMLQRKKKWTPDEVIAFWYDLATQLEKDNDRKFDTDFYISTEGQLIFELC